MNEDYRNRFSGIGRLYGEAGLRALSCAHVCVIGIGGVGTWAAEALARSGVGVITLIDLDDICITNTNRQIHTLTETVGQSKVEVMAERICAINPHAQCHQIEEFVDEDNARALLSPESGAPAYDFVIDAIDDVKAKAAIIACCRRNRVPVISVGGAGGQIDPTQIQVADLSRTFQDPLAAKVRSQLRRFYNFSKNPKRRFDVPCVFSTEQLRYPQTDGTICAQKPELDQDEGRAMRLDCSDGFGAATAVTATFGFVAVSRVLEKLTATS